MSVFCFSMVLGILDICQSCIFPIFYSNGRDNGRLIGRGISFSFLTCSHKKREDARHIWLNNVHSNLHIIKKFTNLLALEIKGAKKIVNIINNKSYISILEEAIRPLNGKDNIYWWPLLSTKAKKNSKGDSKGGKKSSLGLTDSSRRLKIIIRWKTKIYSLLTYQFRLAIFAF